MKKENKRMAQEKRAAERKKQATMQLVRNAIIVALIVAFFVGMIVFGVIDSRKQSADETKKNGNDIYQTETPQKIEQIRIRMLGECDRNGDINQDRRYHPADIHHHFMVEYNVVPGSFGLLHQLGYHP